MAARYKRADAPLFDNTVYTICGDGCLMEGMTSEACALAGQLGLGGLVCLYDDNMITIDGSTEVAFTEDAGATARRAARLRHAAPRAGARMPSSRARAQLAVRLRTCAGRQEKHIKHMKHTRHKNDDSKMCRTSASASRPTAGRCSL